jgi:TldD protein
MAVTMANEHLKWFGVDQGLIRRALSTSMGRGADYADLYFQHTRSTSLRLEDGLVSQASTGVDRGVGVRAVAGDQTGYAYSEDLSEEAILRAARTAAAIADGGRKFEPQAVLPVETPQRYALERTWDQVEVEERLPLVFKADQRLRALDPGVEKASVSWHDSDERLLIATSDGFLGVDRRPMAQMICRITINRDGQRQSHGSNTARREGLEWFSDGRIDELCRQAVDRTQILFEARRPPAGEMPVVLAAGAAGILLHEAIGHGLEADYNRKGTSIYASMLNQKVAPDFVTVVDDGTLDNDRGALNIDDEGRQVESTTLIEDGVLRGYLHDRISARHYGVEPTGSGRRQSFRHMPLPRMRSTYMLDGPHTYDEIIAAVKNGIIAETFTNGQVQIGAGDFTFYIKNGWLIEDGKITAPIKDVNIIGNGPEALKQVRMAAADSRLDASSWTCGKQGQGVPVSLGIPTVLVDRLTVGGVNG